MKQSFHVTARSQDLLVNIGLTVAELVENFFTFYGTQKFIIVSEIYSGPVGSSNFSENLYFA
jgi:hypothetical protein